MPTKGDKLYRVNWDDDSLEIATFIEESVNTAAGATQPTWVIRTPEGQRRVLVGSFETTLPAALELRIYELSEELKGVDAVIRLRAQERVFLVDRRLNLRNRLDAYVGSKEPTDDPV